MKMLKENRTGEDLNIPVELEMVSLERLDEEEEEDSVCITEPMDCTKSPEPAERVMDSTPEKPLLTSTSSFLRTNGWRLPVSSCAAEVDGQQVAVIDTPGLFDTRFDKEETSKLIGQCILYAAPGPHVFLMVIRLGRFTEEEKQTVKKIQEIFGQAADRYSMVLFTGGDDLEDTIESFLTGSPELQELVRRCNGHYHVFNNKNEDRSQVIDLFEKIRNIVQSDGGSHYTNEMFKEAERAIEVEKQRILKEKEEEIRRQQEEVERKLQEKYDKDMEKLYQQFQAERERERKEREEERKMVREEMNKERKREREERAAEREKERKQMMDQLSAKHSRELQGEKDKVQSIYDQLARMRAEMNNYKPPCVIL
ncbi:GTPase IMAP family member 4-like [Channa argus]|uniref:GTPase IMAP family member 4-like n=1 Tax=Channa argus TaxID=215402 RepID=UPI003521BA1D